MKVPIGRGGRVWSRCEETGLEEEMVAKTKIGRGWETIGERVVW